jgi:hypothetical protein
LRSNADDAESYLRQSAKEKYSAAIHAEKDCQNAKDAGKTAIKRKAGVLVNVVARLTAQNTRENALSAERFFSGNSMGETHRRILTSIAGKRAIVQQEQGTLKNVRQQGKHAKAVS